MTQKDFFAVLAKTKSWCLTSDGRIRKGHECQKNVDKTICPVCAVANKLKKKTKYFLNAGEAGQYLGLDEKFVHSVMNASDDAAFSSDRDITIRKKILKTLKLNS